MSNHDSLDSSPRLRVVETGEEFVARPTRLVVAGYTGRDEAAVAAHIDELAALGISPPETVPAFYELNPVLLTTGGVIDVDGAASSGEVEPVLIHHSGRYYLGVGSDHTDRDVERTDIVAAKACCPKPVGQPVTELPPNLSEFDWDAVVVSSSVDEQPYQSGSLASLLPPATLLNRLEATLGVIEGDFVIFAGTLPLLGGEFLPSADWRLQLRLPDGTALTHSYVVRRNL